MRVKQIIALGALALATGAVVAQEVPLTRTEVAQSVVDARAAGTLTPAGEGISPGYGGAGPSQTTRAAVDAQVLQARASGDLVPAAVNSPSVKFYNQLIAAPSTTTRDHVKDEVIEARLDGTLIPAGQGEFAAPESVVHVARHGAPAHEIVASSTAR